MKVGQYEVQVSEQFENAGQFEQHKALHEAAHITIAALCPSSKEITATMIGGQKDHGRDRASYSVLPVEGLNANQELKLRTFIAVAPRMFFTVVAGLDGTISVEHLAGCDADYVEIHADHFVYSVERGVISVPELKSRVLSAMDSSQAYVRQILVRNIQAVFSVADALLVEGRIDTVRVRAIVDPLRQDVIVL